MPFNATFALEHRLGGWESAVELTVVADKNRVDATRNEPRTDDYELVNLPTGYAWGNYRLGLDVQNLFDKGYDLPLGGMSIGDYKARSEEHTSELQSLMRNSYDVFCLKKKNTEKNKANTICTSSQHNT